MVRCPLVVMARLYTSAVRHGANQVRGEALPRVFGLEELLLQLARGQDGPGPAGGTCFKTPITRKAQMVRQTS